MQQDLWQRDGQAPGQAGRGIDDLIQKALGIRLHHGLAVGFERDDPDIGPLPLQGMDFPYDKRFRPAGK